MSGDWIKVCKDTPSKPEVLVVATILNIHPDVAFARCFQLWAWFDSNTKDGVTKGVTKVTIDALLHRDGLCDALIHVGWLGENEDGNLYLPNFDRHNSETAKTRALGKKRQDKHRDKSNANSNANVTLNALPEKRREEKIESKAIASSGAGKPDCPHQEIIALYHEILPVCPAVKDWTPARSSALKARWSESTDRQSLEYWRDLFGYIAGIPFLTGRVTSGDRKPFFASLPWIVKAENFAKIREGNYE